MQWWVLAGWGAVTVLCRKRRGLRWALCAGLAASMAGQLLLLQLDGRLTLETAAPLHLCALSGLLCLPMLLSRSQALYSWMCFLGAPCALLALLFPAVAHSSRQLLMNLAFFSLHALILCAALWRAMKEPLPTDPRVLLSGYLPGYLKDIGAVRQDLPLAELVRLGRISERAKAISLDDPDFSRLIREGVPLAQP